jgi:hypothetical protein
LDHTTCWTIIGALVTTVLGLSKAIHIVFKKYSACEESRSKFLEHLLAQMKESTGDLDTEAE